MTSLSSGSSGVPGNNLKDFHRTPGMDVASKNMYDTFKDEIWKELGPLDPDWFDVLTAQTSTNEGSVSDQDDLCANQEGNFKMPFDKTAVDSQLFSTPRIFRHSRCVSPETEDDQWLPKEQEKETLPWTSPYLFQTPKKGVIEPQSNFGEKDLLRSPQTSPVSYAKHISESLGAQIHADVSWTSSLNTPPAVPSTLILSKTDESPCPVSVSTDKNVVFVRKLFPSLSNASRVGAVLPKNTDMPAPHKGALSPETAQKPHDSPKTSMNPCEGIWRQRLPDAIEDGEIQSTVADVLDGAANVLSIFFTNSSSALRKVKTSSNKRKLISATKEHECSSTDISRNDDAASQQRTTEQEPRTCTSDEVLGFTKCSPLSLSEIPPPNVDTSRQDDRPATQMNNSIVRERPQSDTDSAQIITTPLRITDSGFPKKRRKFIYTVDTSKTQVQGKDITSHSSPDFGHGVNVKKLEEAQNEASCCADGESVVQQLENLPPSLQAKVQDLDMSQLCRDFAEDFSQRSDQSKLRIVVEDPPLNVFSPSACLSAMKRAKQEARHANSHHDGDGISNKRHVFANNHNVSISEGTISDSGFQSAVVDNSHVTTTSFVPLNSQKNTQSESGFNSDTHRTGPFPSTDKGSKITPVFDISQETDTSAIEERQPLAPGKVLHKEGTCVQFPSGKRGTADDIDYVLLSGQTNGNREETSFSLPSIHASGFKTASNKCIQISSANLTRAKCLFEEGERNFLDQLNKSAHDSKEETGVIHGSVTNTVSYSKQSASSKSVVDVNCQLTASQKADVTELCTLLEEADSQFEFTQFKAAKLKPQWEDKATPHQRLDKDLDPDFLMGIDFDDSFSSDADKWPEVTEKMSSISDCKTNYKTSKFTKNSLDTSLSSAVRKESSSIEDVSSSLKRLSEGSSRFKSPEPQNLDRAGHEQMNKQVNNSLMQCMKFQTAGGKDLRVSEQHLSKARALFQDCEGFMTNQKLPNEQSIENWEKTEQAKIKMDTATCQSGFQMASGKGISVSTKHMQEAERFFKDCGGTENDTGKSVKHKKSIEPLPGSVSHKKDPLHWENVQLIEDDFTRPSASYTTSKGIGSSALNELATSDGFFTASGKKVSVSADSLKKAESLLQEINAPDDTNKQLQQTEDASRTSHLKKQIHAVQPTNGGFKTASGKGVVISSAALKKAKSLLSECEPMEEKPSVKPTRPQFPVTGRPSGSGGVPAASGKSAALVSDSRNSHKNQDGVGQTNNIHCGFKTAGGATVHVSQKSLLKAKNLFKEYDDDSVSAKTTRDTDFFRGSDFMDSSSGTSVQCNTSENANLGLDVNHENVPLYDDVEMIKPKSANAASSPLSTTSKSICSSAFKGFSSSGGFSTASGKKVSVSDDALTKAKSLLNDTCKQLKHSEGALPLQRGGFQTASGKEVAVSAAALEKAKTLLSDCEGVNGKSGVKLTHLKTGSDEPASFSSEALQRAEALCSPERSAAREEGTNNKPEDAAKSPIGIHGGFRTAGGAKVHVSHASLSKAKYLLKEFADGDGNDSNSYSTSPPDAKKSVLAEVKDVKGGRAVITGTEKEIVKLCPSFQETNHEDETLPNINFNGYNSIQHKTRKNELECEEDTSCCNSREEEMATVLGCEVNQTSTKVGHDVKNTSRLTFHSLNISGCVETQQQFLAQEALDCTKALLEDDGLDGQSVSVTLENVTLQDDPRSSSTSAGEQKGRGKRAGEDGDIGQPPPKRRLLEEFDRSVDGCRASALHPEKSCPKSVMNDRKVFKYNESLHPITTRPHGDGTNYVEGRLQEMPTQSSTPGSAHSKMSVFVPPFHKKTGTESCKNNVRTPAFIPPFKKQRTTVQQSSRPVKEAREDQRHPPSATASNSNVYVPPTKKTQSSTHLTGNISKDQTRGSSDINNINLIINRNHPAGCGSEDSSAEAAYAADTLSRSKETFPNLESLELARDMQDMRIRKKKRQTIRPLPGRLVLTKTSGMSRISLKDAANRNPAASFSTKQLYELGVHQHVSEVTSETAEDFRFSLQQFLKQEAFVDSGGVQLADGGWLIVSNDGTAGRTEFYKALCDTPGVDPKLIGQEWVYNHYRWIVWKLASMERSFPEIMGSLCLTPEQVLLQLKYRYDVEVDNSRRPALRKIMERDDTAAKTLVLCVCGVVSSGDSLNKRRGNEVTTPRGSDAKVESPCAVVWLTDGWYSIKAQLDEPLTAMLYNGRVAEGVKLIIHGAQLVGSQDACSPLEAPESLMLKINANSSRPARWDTKLGFYRDPRPFLLPVSSLYSNGGPVGCVDVMVLRSYPIQWMERKPDGGVVFRSDRAEEKEARRYNSHKQKAMEIVFAKIQAEFEEEKCNKPQHRRKTLSRQDVASLHDGEELHEAVGDDPTYLEAYLSGPQLETLHAYRCSLMEKKQAELQDRYRRALESEASGGSCPKRDVTPVWRLSVADSMDQSGRVYQLNLWRPSFDLQSVLKEGCRYKVFNLTTSDGKKRSGVETVQLTGTKKTQFQDLQVSQKWLCACYQARVSASFVDLQNPEFQPLCGEVDLTGYVISVTDEQGSSPVFYLTDGRMNFVKVRCFSSLSHSGLEDVIKAHMLLAVSNLQLRGQSTSPTPVVFAGDLTAFSTNPKEPHLQDSLSQLRSLVQGHENFYSTAEEKLSNLVKSGGLTSPALQPLTPLSTTDGRRDTSTSAKRQQPIRSLGSCTPVSRNPPAPAASTEKDPRSLKRRRALDYLSRIPSPPALSHLGSVASPCINRTFNPPRRSGIQSTLKPAQSPACRPINSPVENDWVNDEELAMIDTQALRAGNVDI